MRIIRAVVIKTIRADAGMVGLDGDDLSGLLVIHLVRDPRAVVHSQIKTFNVTNKYRNYFKAPEHTETKVKALAAERSADRSLVPSAAKPPTGAKLAGEASLEKATVAAGGVAGRLPRSGRERAHVLGLM